MKKGILFTGIAVALMILTVSCSSGFKDGLYFVAEEEFSTTSGWKSIVTIKVTDGKISHVDWDGVNKKGGFTKDEASKIGSYPMVAGGGAQADWHVQAEKVEAYLKKTNDPAKIVFTDDNGHTDDISGVSIHVNDFYALANKALDAGPVKFGMYKNGMHQAEEADFAGSGWKSTIDIRVINGYIVNATWNGLHKDGGDDKITRSENGEYVMTEGGTPWHDQAKSVEAVLIDSQDPAKINYSNDEGNTDEISGVSIHVKAFFTLAQKALANQKR